VVALTAVLLPATALADVSPSQRVQMEQDRPVKGRFRLGYTNYHEKAGLCSGSRKYGTYHCDGYRVKRGALATKLVTYALDEKVDRFDYYLLDVDINNANTSGSSRYGWTKVTIKTLSGKLVDSTEIKGISAQERDCDTLNLSISTPWPGVTGSADLGSVRFCDDRAKWTRSRKSPALSIYRANMLGRTSHLSAQRWVKVRHGNRPSFEVTVRVPRDTCTSSRDGWCTRHSNGSAAKTWRIGTT
jgi:hypothetical protein